MRSADCAGGAGGHAGRTVCLIGATGTIGRATAAALAAAGHELVCLVRALPRHDGQSRRSPLPDGTIVRTVDLSDPVAIARDGFGGQHFDAVVSCMASRSGTPADAWAVDHRAHCHVLDAAQAAGVAHFVLVSAICVQKPLLAFQHAKLAFEAALIASGMRYSIVRPTAYFKSLAGQIDRVRAGKPYLMFGNGELTACKPISDEDLAAYVVGCLTDEGRWNRILPIGGPGDPITPREQGALLFDLLGQSPRYRSVPVRLLDLIVGGLAIGGRVIPSLAAKAELARIGRYYATESMLVRNPDTGRYDAAATPSTGTRTLADFYRAVIAGEIEVDRGDHAVF